jgi:hypothetical protein
MKTTGEELTRWAENAFPLFRCEDRAQTSEAVALTVGRQAARMGWTEDGLVKWLQTAYGSVWVRQSDLVPGLDLKDVQKALLRGFRT